jgi:hypothetical protein
MGADGPADRGSTAWADGRAMPGRMKRVPRLPGLCAWTLGAVAMHAIVPFELSRLGDRAGRPPGGSGAVRGSGLVMVAAGAGLMAWALAATARRRRGGGRWKLRWRRRTCCGAARTG